MFRVTDLAISTCAGTTKGGPFGFTPYTCRGIISVKEKTSHVSNKEKYKSFTEIHSNLYKSNPGPNGKYKVEGADWLETFQKHRGPFLKKPRDTFTADVMKFHKALPAPSKYHSDRYGGSGLIRPKNLVNFKQ